MHFIWTLTRMILQVLFCSDMETEALGTALWQGRENFRKCRSVCPCGFLTPELCSHYLFFSWKVSTSQERSLSAKQNQWKHIFENVYCAGVVWSNLVSSWGKQKRSSSLGFLNVNTVFPGRWIWMPSAEVVLMRKLLLHPNCHSLDIVLGATFPICTCRAEQWHLAPWWC